MKLILIFVLFMAQTFTYSAVFEQPDRDKKAAAIEQYGWMDEGKGSIILTHIDEVASDFFNENYIEYLVEENLKSHMVGLEIIDSSEPYTKATIHQVRIYLSKYSESSNIYYGSVTLKTVHTHWEKGSRPYIVSTQMAGNRTEIKGRVKIRISKILETYAEDVFYIREAKR